MNPASSSYLNDANVERPAHWGGVLAMTLCVFTLIASEFMPVSLLTLIAHDLGISEGLAGYGIAVSGVFAVVTSLCIARLAGQLDRKTLLLGLTALMCASSLVVGLAQGYVMYLIGRALIGVVIGGFWSLSAAVAMRLVPRERVPRALAIFNSGNALATVIAAPLGSFLGGVIGWRGAFLCLVPVGLAALTWQWLSLPALPARARQSASGVVALLGRPQVIVGMLAAGLFFMGQFGLFTYIRPFLETVTQVDVTTLSMLLLTLGLAGFAGTLLIGALLRSGLYRTLIAIPLVMAVLAVGLIGMGQHLAAVFGLLALWGLVATAAPVGWWAWLAHSLPDDAEAGGGLMVAVVQLSIALGSTLGGMLFDEHGYRITFLAAAALLVASAAMTLATSRIGRSANV
ncbi:MAG: major facilitator [Pseudomonas sp.]|uniref:MFS transporter n=1 Tax=Pseudomonas entomophila TaxID=312306 RepID=UPI0021598C02|nr:MFS transporter [Pseudomonas entomophila]MDF2489187.1 major facilitator [Pseudomonas sp.]